MFLCGALGTFGHDTGITGGIADASNNLDSPGRLGRNSRQEQR
jgi:hypothetical protein